MAKLAVSAAGIAVLAGCVPDLGPMPERHAPQDFATDRSVPNSTGTWPSLNWWIAYNDPVLNGLIEEALKGSPGLAVAQARLDQAEAAERQAGAAGLPTISADISVQPTQQSRNIGFPDSFKALLPRGWHTQGRAAANLTYELDFFGKNRAALAAATSDAEAAQVEVAAARMEISTAVAAAYADLVRLAADRVASADAVRIRQDSAALVADRVKQALENEGELSLARAQVGSAQADLDAVDGQIGLLRNQIAALLGKGPDRGLDIAVPTQTHIQPLVLPPSLAADLIGRRPDLVAARLRAAAAAERINVARADFYPNIDLNGFVGLQSLDIKDLLMKDSIIGQIGPALHLPIFDGGRIEGNYRGARANYDEAVATYDKTLTNAFHEVADAIVNQREVQVELAHSRGALAEAENAYRIANLRYGAGLSRYLDVLTAEDSLLIARRRVADLEARSFTQNIALVRALGGGFSTDNEPQGVR